MSGVQFTITTVEFQDGPYQPDTTGGPGGDEAGGPLDPVTDTSDPTTETAGGGAGGGWGHPLAKLRLGGSGRAALVLDPADVDLRLALRPSGTASITTATDLADVSAIEGLYPPVAETTTRAGTLNFQLVVTAPAGEQISADGVTWGTTVTFDASAATALIQDPDAADSIDTAATPITIIRTVQRRSGGFYRDSTITLSADVPTRMINPATSWRTIMGTDAAAAGFPFALVQMPAEWTYAPDPAPTDDRYPLDDYALNGTLLDGGASWSNLVTPTAETVVTVGSGATPAAAAAAAVLQTQAVIVAINTKNTDGSSDYAGSNWVDLANPGSPLQALPTEAQLAALSTDTVKVLDVWYVVPSWLPNTKAPGEDDYIPKPFVRRAITFISGDHWEVAYENGWVMLASVAIYIAKSVQRATWP